MTAKHLLGAFAALVLGFHLPSAQAARPDFSKIEGTYKATYLLSSGTTVIRGNVEVTIAVLKNGSAQMRIVGYGTPDGSPDVHYALLGDHTFKASRAIVSNNVAMAYVAQIQAAPTRFSGSGNHFRFQLTSASSVATGALSYTMNASSRKLTINGSGDFSGNATQVVIVGKRQTKK